MVENNYTGVKQLSVVMYISQISVKQSNQLVHNVQANQRTQLKVKHVMQKESNGMFCLFGVEKSSFDFFPQFQWIKFSNTRKLNTSQWLTYSDSIHVTDFMLKSLDWFLFFSNYTHWSQSAISEYAVHHNPQCKRCTVWLESGSSYFTETTVYTGW